MLFEWLHAQKNWPAKSRPKIHWRIEPCATNTYAKLLARSVHAPGGWGAEESGERSGPGPEATVSSSQFSLAGAWPKWGRIMIRINESVMPAVQNAARHRADRRGSALGRLAVFSYASDASDVLRRVLPAARVRRDHEARDDKRRRRMNLGETEPSEWRGGEQRVAAPAKDVTFSRRELDRILGLYGRMVAAGEWRDYAIDFLKDRAVFSVFRRASEVPIYRIEKNPRLGAPTGRLQRDFGNRPDRAPRPRARPRARALDPARSRGGRLSARSA